MVHAMRQDRTIMPGRYYLTPIVVRADGIYLTVKWRDPIAKALLMLASGFGAMLLLISLIDQPATFRQWLLAASKLPWWVPLVSLVAGFLGFRNYHRLHIGSQDAVSRSKSWSRVRSRRFLTETLSWSVCPVAVDYGKRASRTGGWVVFGYFRGEEAELLSKVPVAYTESEQEAAAWVMKAQEQLDEMRGGEKVHA